MIESRRRYQSNMRETPYHLRGRRGHSHIQSSSKPSLASAAQRSTNLTTSRYAQPSSVVGSRSGSGHCDILRGSQLRAITESLEPSSSMAPYPVVGAVIRYSLGFPRFAREAVKQQTNPLELYDNSTAPLKSSLSTREIRREPNPTREGSVTGGPPNSCQTKTN